MILPNTILIIIQIILLSISVLYGLTTKDPTGVIFLTLSNYIISFIVVNRNKRNIINISNFFLLGVGLLILGRFIGYLIYPDYFDIHYIFCNDFFFSYCLSPIEAIKALLFFNFSIVCFCIGYIKSVEIGHVNNSIIGTSLQVRSKKISFLVISSYILLAILYFSSLKQIILAVSQGYLAIFKEQAEAYQPPLILIANSLLIAILSIFYSIKKDIISIRLHFKILFFAFCLLGLLSIITGGRTGFITTILVIIWYLWSDKKIKLRTYYSLGILSIIVLGFTNQIAELSGARVTGSTSGLRANIADTFYSQGGTFMIANAAINMENPPVLGYLKTILPGIQIIFPYLGYDNRYEFDWSSYLAYSTDRTLYESGSGLGWSIFADFYHISFKLLPLYGLLLIIWGYFINKIDSQNSSKSLSIAFILSFYAFSLSRNSISPIIFTLICFYIILSWLKTRTKF